MNHSHNHPEIVEACRVLFGPGVAVTERFMVSLHITKLRNIFRERALELHPDRARVVGVDQVVLTERFKNVQQAYQKLIDFISKGRHLDMGGGRHPGSSTPPPSTWVWSPQDGSDKPHHHYWNGRLPGKELLLGQFLYYSGNISWGTLIEAITCQRSQRPPFGRIAKKWNYLDNLQISDSLSDRAKGERIGDSAVRLGHLNRFQRNSVLGFQRWIQRPFGAFFIENKILRSEDLHEMVNHQKRHNLNMKRSRG